MFKKLYTYFKNKKAIKREAIAKAKKRREEIELAANTELYTQSLVNVRHISSTLKVLDSIQHTVKGDSAADTRKKRESAKARIEWYKRKLTEEKAMVKYFADLTGIE